MKKIDLHIHTIAAPYGKDVDFIFDVPKFKEYVDVTGLNVVAITNHNLFNLEQFNEIVNELEKVKVLPGIEIDYEDGHLLLIAENDNLEDFDRKCALIEDKHNRDGKIKKTKLLEIFGDLSQYLLIPHNDKEPKVGQIHIDSLNGHITTGEVSSPKGFYRQIKKDSALVPVLFSDVRIKSELVVSSVQGRQTYIKTNAEEVTLSAIKSALQDKNKVFLTHSEKHDFFEIFGDGQELSQGLNVILGNRSSGKTYFLDKIKETFGYDESDIKYIKQFELVRIGEGKFNKMLEKQRSLTREEYLDVFKPVVEDVLEIDRKATLHNVEEYVTSLIEYAQSEKLQDEYSKASLFKGKKFVIKEYETLKLVITAVKTLLEETNHKAIINKHLSDESMKALLEELALKLKSEALEKLKKEWVNTLVDEVSKKLQLRSSRPAIKNNDLSFSDIKIEKEKIRRFNAIAKAVRKNQSIHKDKKGKFTIEALVGPFKGALEVKNESKSILPFKDAFHHYQNPFKYLGLLSNKELERASLYKYFCKVRYQVLNEYDKPVSGGEMTEFNLLQKLHDARQYEMLLVDEPESSFDNVFLKENVNKILKEISEELPVVVVTHNNTVGMLLKPDYVVYTRREIEQGEDKYYIYSGSPGEKDFYTTDKSKSIESHIILLNALEAGTQAYEDRGKMYGNYKK
ncbi:MAG: hypothetical protein WC025_01040 [Candidatus Magasanikbacteria bacterium]